MQEQYLYEYALIRVVPRVEREEFINVGVILYCAKLKFLKIIYTIDSQRLRALCATLDLNELEEHLGALGMICAGDKSGGPISSLDTPSRFRWLTATRSTIVQSSKVHPGFCLDAALSLDKIFCTMVL